MTSLEKLKAGAMVHFNGLTYRLYNDELQFSDGTEWCESLGDVSSIDAVFSYSSYWDYTEMFNRSIQEALDETE